MRTADAARRKALRPPGLPAFRLSAPCLASRAANPPPQTSKNRALGRERRIGGAARSRASSRPGSSRRTARSVSRRSSARFASSTARLAAQESAPSISDDDSKLADRVADRIDGLAERIDTLAEIARSAAGAVVAREGELAAIRNELGELRGRIERAVVDLHRLDRAPVESLQQTASVLSTGVDALTQGQARLLERVDSLTETREAARETLGGHARSIADLRSEVEASGARMNSVVAVVRQAVESLLSQVETGGAAFEGDGPSAGLEGLRRRVDTLAADVRLFAEREQGLVTAHRVARRAAGRARKPATGGRPDPEAPHVGSEIAKPRRRKMKIQWKLLVVLLLPLLALAAVVGVEVVDRRGEAREADRARQLIELLGAGNDLRDGVQLQVALGALPRTNDVARRLRTAQLETEADIRTFNDALASLDLSAFGPGFAQAVGDVEAALRDYESAAPSARTRPELGGAVSTAVVDELGPAAARTIAHDGQLARAAVGYTSLIVANERRSDLFYRLTEAIQAGPVTRRTLRGITSQEAEGEVALAIFRSAAPSGQRDDLAALSRDRTSARAGAAIDDIQGTSVGMPVVVETASFVPAMERRIRLLESFTRGVGADIETLAAEKRDEAQTSALLYLLLGIAAIVVAFGLAVALIVSIVRRLNQLTRSAHYFSERQLPAVVESLRNPKATEAMLDEAIFLGQLGNDEIGEVGQAFNTVQTTFAGVARDHVAFLRRGIGDIFVKLARRNQSLVERQIELLDELESKEQDPDVLESLFKLDHLATRMRRNAESLLVLAGSAPARTWSGPVPLDELLQGAMAEIEDYGRIQAASGSVANTVEVVGSAAPNLAHLVAELLDNAVRFSPSDTTVDVLVRRRGEACVVYITDTGMGMTDEQLEEANELLVSPPEPGLDLSRTLGLYVAARLAARHGVTVRLARSAYDGIVASVTLPPELVVELRRPEPATAENGNGHGNGNGNGHLPDVREVESLVATPTASNGSHEAENGEPSVGSQPLPQRVVQDVPEAGPVSARASEDGSPERALGAVPSLRSPDERRQQLSSFLRRLDEGRSGTEPQTGLAEEETSWTG